MLLSGIFLVISSVMGSVLFLPPSFCVASGALDHLSMSLCLLQWIYVLTPCLASVQNRSWSLGLDLVSGEGRGCPGPVLISRCSSRATLAIDLLWMTFI